MARSSEKKVRFERAVYIVKQVVNRGKWLFGLILANYVLCGFIYSWLEARDIETSLWWAFVTGSTTGYGDEYPTSLFGRILGVYLIKSTWYLSLVAGAYITARVVVDYNEWSHEEQLQVMTALLLIGKANGIYPQYYIKLPPSSWMPGDQDPEECLPPHMQRSRVQR